MTLRGELNNAAKLTEDKVRAIRLLYASGGITHRSIATQYGVDAATVAKITERRNWGWVDDVDDIQAAADLVPSDSRRCKKCHLVKLLVENFGRISEGRYRGDCKACRNAEEKARARSHRPSTQPEYKRNERMRRLFGITLHEYEALYEAQGQVCAICGDPCSYKRRDQQPLVVDHDHATGQVRGLLCHYCNGLLGWARDNPQTLASAIVYLTRVEVRQEEDADVRDVLNAVERKLPES